MKYLKNGESLKPALLWKHFDSILGIPRASQKEEKLSEYIYNFGKSLNLDTVRDEIGNVIIKKPSTSGKKKIVVLQSHIDMVPQKTAESNHNFDTDPVYAYVDGNVIRAESTTLGADNGVGVAAMMTLLESDDIEHGPIEALFTIDEETGMTGVKALNPKLIDGRLLLNLDSEDDGQIFIGCAGGIDTNIYFNFKSETPEADFLGYKIKLFGMNGGHSGGDIHLGRANAIKMLNRVLWEINRKADLRLVSFSGGTLRNVIASNADAFIAIKSSEVSVLKSVFEDISSKIKAESKVTEPNMAFVLEKEKKAEIKILPKKVSNSLFNAIYATPFGIIKMHDTIKNLVETSINIGSIATENNSISLTILSRSSVNSAIIDMANRLSAIYEMAEATKIKHSGYYPGWLPSEESYLLKIARDSYRECFNVEPEVLAVHAGLECALIGDKFEGMDMISIGPTIKDAHSVREYCDIKTVERFWKHLSDILSKID